MPTPTRPSTYLNWCPAQNPADVQQPTTGQATTGWATNQKTPRQYENYINNLLDRWTQWLDYITQNALLPATTTILTTTGALTNGSPTVTGLASTANLHAGSAVSGTGIAAGAYVLEVFGTTAVLSKPATATGTETLTFAHELALGTTAQAQLDELDAAVSRNRAYDIVVGSGADCDYATLAALVADTTVGPNKRILLIESQTLNASVTFSQNFWRIEGLPGVALTNGTAGTGLIASARGVEIRRLRMVGFTIAVQYLVAGVYGRVVDCSFNSCPTDVDDSAIPAANQKPRVYGTITE